MGIFTRVAQRIPTRNPAAIYYHRTKTVYCDNHADNHIENDKITILHMVMYHMGYRKWIFNSTGCFES